ncbi:MAG: ferrous iron transporter B [Candidatus Omnitrophica bacterium]|nr:ferrous iron transporter B [Candidatus Omnitrophota bacterium]MBU4479288.1 ferrous iron transporter B [Candidatus Omnitrophota bacterium]MCG2703269.1 ferrous iron transporter B [Candidatus Omnitrophota bacterium]
MKKIVLIGNPNVGKSVLFSRLTGVRVLVSNYPGTTVEFLEGYLCVDDEQMQVIDLPGTYSLEPSVPAEEVSVKMLSLSDIIVNVIDATNLERNLYLTMELIETGRPMVVALNMFDERKHRGVDIDARQLEKLLGVPVIPTSGITGMGIKALKERLKNVPAGKSFFRTHEERWSSIGHITESVQRLSHRHHTFWEALEDASVNHAWGLIIAGGIIFAGFKFIRFVAEGLINTVFEPFFQNVYLPLLERLSVILGQGGLLHSLLIGKMIDGKIDFQQSLGLLTTAPYVEFVMVLPYVFSFYLLLSFLEDSGYIPRLALLLDNVMHKLGLHGFAIIPVLLGFGCNVPGILGTRILESKRERFIAATLISIGVPCAALQAMIVGILGKFGGRYVALVYAVLFCLWLFLGLAMNYFLKGYSPELLLEIPPYRFPALNLLAKKIVMRIRGFIIEALPIIMLSILVINILQQVRIFEFISALFSPLLGRVFGLPKEAIWVLIIGLLRKDIAAGMLIPLHLSVKQLIIACLVLSMSFPCIATVVIFLKELGWKRLGQAALIMVGITTLVGGIMNVILP